MDAPGTRELLTQLSADFQWLERHCAAQPELAREAAHLRLAAALTRNVLAPALEGVTAPPLHLAVIGGAGAGKSTVTNLLLGQFLAEANPQAGYTRHPKAFAPTGVAFPSTLGFLGSLSRTVEALQANRDEDIYQVERVTPHTPAGEFVVWDCPDMTTWASQNYVARLLEVIGLADVIVYVASVERYNDEIPTQFLHHVARMGKAVVPALTKVLPKDIAQLEGHFRGQVLSRLPGEAATRMPVVAVPWDDAINARELSPDALEVRARLWNEVLAYCPTAAEARARTVANAVAYLETASGGLLGVARAEFEVVKHWKNLVELGRAEFEGRYRREYLSGEAFTRFDRAKVETLALLDLPGGARVLSGLLGALRWPYRAARDALVKLATRPTGPTVSEREVCELGLEAWLDGLQAQVLSLSDRHPAWRAIARDFERQLRADTAEQFGQVFRQFAARETDELDSAVQAVPRRLESSPALLGTLRAGSALLDLGLAATVLILCWQPTILELLLIPLVVGLGRQAVELAVGAAIDRERSRVRDRREALVARELSGPVAHWLAERPGQGKSDFGELRRVLERVPRAVKSIAERLAPHTGEKRE